MNDTTEYKRCVIYTRKSTDEGLDKEFNSLEAQFDACSAYITSQASKGWHLLNKHYDDGGYSGGNTNRPALQQLIKDVAERRIDIVVVYKFDRISRSLSDFMEMTKLFERYNVSLVSVTQQIDTSSSMGRMIVNLLMSFAQFEREMTSDRVRDKMAASRKRGMWTGGIVPYGYKTVDRRLVVDPERAQEVLFAFERYDACKSFLAVAHALKERFGARRDGNEWNVMSVRCLLKQAIPAGKIRDSKTGELYDALHEAIVPIDLWLRVQKHFEDRASVREAARCESSAPLKGILKCGYCECAMVPTWCYKGKKRFHYYRCSKTHKNLVNDCQLKNIGAGAVEQEVFKAFSKTLQDEIFLQSLSIQCDLSVEQIRGQANELSEDVLNMTDAQRKRIAEKMFRRVDVKRDSIDLVLRSEGLIRFFKKGKINE